MTLNEYQEQARGTAKYPAASFTYFIPLNPLPLYPAIGLAGETGEVLEEIKKAWRDDGGAVTEGRLESLTLEMGDVLWYLSQLASDLGLTLEEIAAANLHKLSKRYAERNG